MRIFRPQTGRGYPSSGVEDGQKQSLLANPQSTSQWYKAKKSFRRHWQLYLVMVPALLYFFVFKYIPIANAVIAFKEYNVVQGIWGSPWVGLKYFNLFFENPVFWTLIKNTLAISLYALVVGFPIPIILAICLNEIRDGFFRRFTQLVTYAPYFISTVIIVSMLILLLSPRLGAVNLGLEALGLKPINFLGVPALFAGIFAWSGVWQFSGYAAVIYLAALSGIDPQLHDAAKVDGASRLQKIRHVDLPGIMPVILVILILNVGSLLSVSFEKIFLLQNPLNLATSEVISTYVYKIGLLNANYSFATAVGLFNSVIGMILLVLVNSLAKRFSDSGAGLW
ncbi:MAG: sugar ABC transporter permease [Anaerolineae bacterium]|nr:sugar ABC transporter permease [Anaerolineae bacterium]